MNPTPLTKKQGKKIIKILTEIRGLMTNGTNSTNNDAQSTLTNANHKKDKAPVGRSAEKRHLKPLPAGTKVRFVASVNAVRAGEEGTISSCTASWHYVEVERLPQPVICRRCHLEEVHNHSSSAQNASSSSSSSYSFINMEPTATMCVDEEEETVPFPLKHARKESAYGEEEAS